jgi:hypothetical protein
LVTDDGVRAGTGLSPSCISFRPFNHALDRGCLD